MDAKDVCAARFKLSGRTVRKGTVVCTHALVQYSGPGGRELTVKVSRL